MDKLKKVISQTSWQVLGKVISSIATLIALYVVAHHFGTEGTGVFTLALTYLYFFYIVVDLGVNAHLLPQFIDNTGTLVWRKLFGFRLGWSVIVILFAGVLLFFLPYSPEFNQSVVYGLSSILLYVMFVTANAFFQAKLRFDLSILASTATSVVGALGVIALTYYGATVSQLMLGQLLGWGTCAILALFFVRKFVSKSTPVIDLNFSKQLVKDTWPISLTLILNAIYFRVDAFLLGVFRPLAEVGIYNFAFQFFQAALVFPTFIMNGYYPIMIKSLKESKSQFKKEFALAAVALLALGLLGTGVTYLLAPLLVPFFSGGIGFEGSVPALQILALGFPAYFLSSLCMWALIVFKEYKKMAAVYAIGLIINTVFNYLLIAQYGYIGSSVITAVSEYLILIMQIAILYPLLKDS